MPQVPTKKTDFSELINSSREILASYKDDVESHSKTKYLQKVAGYINSKISEFDALEEYRHIPLNMKATLIQLNIADDFFKAKAQVEKLERDMELKDKEIYDLKHDLIANQIKTETAEASMKELEAENKELLLNKARLEATLEDTLLDGKQNRNK